MSAVVVVGGGLAGCLVSLLLARRGIRVELYELRADSRRTQDYAGRSINLALSSRGRSALHAAGLTDEEINALGVPMKGRFMHPPSGPAVTTLYGQHGETNLSIHRQRLNELLLTKCDETALVSLHFEHKLQTVDLRSKTVSFVTSDGRKDIKYDRLLGCDGAFSKVRAAFMRRGRFNFAQEYIDHGYKELTIPAKDGDFALDPNYLHIWARGEYMMIGLPNCDKSITLTVFMAHEPNPKSPGFNAITTREQAHAFLGNFPDVYPALMPSALDEWDANPVGNLVQIKCERYHYQDSAALLGDSAHALVPFYGQGMNCAFEDAHKFAQLCDKNGNDWASTMSEYTAARWRNGAAIQQLSMRNYIEMRSKVNNWWFRARSRVEGIIHRLFFSSFIPLYSMVSYHPEIEYHDVIQKCARQEKLLDMVIGGIFCTIVGAAGLVLARQRA